MLNCFKGLKYALLGHIEIHPCVLQDIGPLGPLPKKGGGGGGKWKEEEGGGGWNNWGRGGEEVVGRAFVS